MTDAKKITFVGGLLRGAALLWHSEDGIRHRSYERYEDAFLKHFQPFPNQLIARQALEALKYSGSVSGLASQFRKLMQDVTMTEEDKVHNFIRKLPDSFAADVRLVGQA